MALTDYRETIERAETDYIVGEAFLVKQENKYQSVLEKKAKLEHTEAIIEEVNSVFSYLIEAKITNSKAKIESLTNQGLSYIFGNQIKIVINSEFKNNKTLFSLRLVKDDLNEGLTENFGGGVLSVVGFLLKVITVILCQRERFMILDENLAMVSEEYQSKLSEFIQKLCKQMHFTIVVIAHQPKLSEFADVVYQAEGDPLKGISFKREAKDQYEASL